MRYTIDFHIYAIFMHITTFNPYPVIIAKKNTILY